MWNISFNLNEVYTKLSIESVNVMSPRKTLDQSTEKEELKQKKTHLDVKPGKPIFGDAMAKESVTESELEAED